MLNTKIKKNEKKVSQWINQVFKVNVVSLHNLLLITFFRMNGFTTAILKDHSQYWVVDTDSIDRQGRLISNGNAGMFKYFDVNPSKVSR